MKLITILKFCIFCTILIFVPFTTALVFDSIYESNTILYLGFILGFVIDIILFYIFIEPIFKSALKYARKKEQEKLIKKENPF